MKSDHQLQKEVMKELLLDPGIVAENIGVAVKNGIVTLSGFVLSDTEKLAAEKAAFRVVGLQALAMEIVVKLPGGICRNDQDVAEGVVNILKHNIAMPDSLQIAVEQGIVTLRGDVEEDAQFIAIESALRRVIGVKDVINLISINSRVENLTDKRGHHAPI